MAKIKTKKFYIEELKEYENNPRSNNKAVRAVTESVKDFGYINPIIVNQDGVILAGHTRLKALKELDADEVECIVISHLTEEEEKAFRIADNRAAEFSEWDPDLLVSEMKKVDADDWEKYGFKDKELAKLQPPEICKCPKCGKSFYI